LRPDTKNWIESASYDLETAKYMLSSERFLYVIFLCHLSLEKMLKALVSVVTGKPAPRSHDLIYLVKRSEAKLSPELYEFLSKLNNASIPTRYPDNLQQTLSEYSKEVAESYLKQTEEIVRWLRSQTKLQE
jgi:HEPN domain-containing protein